MMQAFALKFAKNDREFTESLFNPSGTASGFYKVTRAGIVLMDQHREERAFIRRDGLGPVSLGKANGRRVYMLALSTIEGKWLGAPDSYSARKEEAQRIAKALFP
ncbi:MAG: hypothetical protein INH13_25755 [Cupriavidus sp.]|nr:hypothetical protein [Cupriavidus sp.]